MLWAVGEHGAALKECEAAIPDLDRRPDLAIRATVNLAMPLVPDVPTERHLWWLDRASGLVSKVSPSDGLEFMCARASTLLLLGEEAGCAASATFPEQGSSARIGQPWSPSELNFGGSGQLPKHWAYQDARIQRIFGGANEIMKMIVGRKIVGHPERRRPGFPREFPGRRLP